MSDPYEPMDDSDSLIVHPAQSFYHPYAGPRNLPTLPAKLRVMVYHVWLILPEINLALEQSNIKPKLSLGILRTCRHRESLSAVIKHFEFNGFSCSAVGRIEKFRFLADLRLSVYGLMTWIGLDLVGLSGRLPTAQTSILMSSSACRV